jgi:hypothetical protein
MRRWIEHAAARQPAGWLPADANGFPLDHPSPLLVNALRALTSSPHPAPARWEDQLLALVGKSEPRLKAKGLPAPPPGCREFFCAVEALFGRKEGLRIAYLYLRHGLNASPYVGLPTSPRTPVQNFLPNELDDAILALEQLPSGLRRFRLNYPFQRIQTGASFYPEAARQAQRQRGFSVSAVSLVLFMEKGLNNNRTDRQATTLHEMAHAFAAGRQEMDVRPEWLALSAWVRTDDWKVGKPSCLVSQYSAESPKEDFAEAFVAYRFAPAALEARCPAKYAFLRQHVFQGVEFKIDAQCRASTPNPIASTAPAGNGFACRADADGGTRLTREPGGQRLGRYAFGDAATCALAVRSSRPGIVCAPTDRMGAAPAYRPVDTRGAEPRPIGEFVSPQIEDCLSHVSAASSEIVCATTKSPLPANDPNADLYGTWTLPYRRADGRALLARPLSFTQCLEASARARGGVLCGNEGAGLTGAKVVPYAVQTAQPLPVTSYASFPECLESVDRLRDGRLCVRGTKGGGASFALAKNVAQVQYPTLADCWRAQEGAAP